MCFYNGLGFEPIKDREESFNSSRRLGQGVRDLCSKRRPFVIAGTVTSHGLSWLEKSKLNLTSLTDNSCSDLCLSLSLSLSLIASLCLACIPTYVCVCVCVGLGSALSSSLPYVSRGNRCQRRRPASHRLYQAICRGDSNSDPVCQSAYQIGAACVSIPRRRCVCRLEAPRAFSLPVACKLSETRQQITRG